MSFELPKLDTQTYAQLLTELVRRIPQYTDQWTDYNDSDPGITLLQMLAWIDESLLYQADRIPTTTDENFLRWVLGLAFSNNVTEYSTAAQKQHDADFLALQATLAQIESGPPVSRATLQRDVLLYQQQPYMALTLPNAEQLALETNRVIAAQIAQQAKGATTPLMVARADATMRGEAIVVHILADAPVAYTYPSWPNKSEYLGSTTTARSLLLLQPVDASGATNTLLAAVRKYLAPRVVAGNALLVAPAQLTPIDLTITVRCLPGSNLAPILGALVSLLYDYLLPTGGPVGGWRYGEAPSADDLAHLVLGTPGVEDIEAFDYTYLPTVVPGVMAQLGANTLLAELPSGRAAQRYAGLPRLRCLDITATGAS